MNLEELRAKIQGTDTEALQNRVMEIRANRRNLPAKKQAAREAESLDKKLDGLSAEGIAKLIEILEGEDD